MKEVIKYIKPRIVKIICPELDSKGSGFVISKDGYIATNFHVVGEITTNGKVKYANKIIVSNSVIEETEAIIAHDKTKTEPILHDFAIIKINKDNLEYFELGTGEEVEEGEEVFFGGFPLTQNNLTSHKGFISSIREASTSFGTTLQKVIDIDGTVVGGNSGGPLIISKSGKYLVVGIISQQVAFLTEAFQQLEQYLKIQMTNPSGGAVFISGVNPNAALFETIKILKANISTGIGTAIFIDYLKKNLPPNWAKPRVPLKAERKT
jgi:S1-C subfamily serine protease